MSPLATVIMKVLRWGVLGMVRPQPDKWRAKAETYREGWMRACQPAA